MSRFSNVVVAVTVAVAVGVGVLVWSSRGGSDGRTEGRGLTGGDLHSLVVDPDVPERLYVGGHHHVSVSTDGGATWAEVEPLRNADAMGWAFTSDAVYVSGHPGLNRSTDGGDSFERTNEGLPDTDLHAFGGSDDVLYAASPAVGVFASIDGGESWTVLTNAAGHAFFGRILVDPADPERLLAADAAAGVAESTDGGLTWRLADSGLDSATWISAGGDGLELIVASGPEGAAASRDGGASWQPLDVPAGASLVEAVPGDAGTLYAGLHSDTTVEVRVSTDGGETWQSVS